MGVKERMNMQIKPVAMSDIPCWEAISAEYDKYVMELVDNLDEWYHGNDDSMAFSSYMASKIDKEEAFMMMDSNDICLGIIAFSKQNNRITFFGVTRNADLLTIGNALLSHAFKYLDVTRDISINEIASQDEWLEQHRRLYISYGFAPAGNALENSVPVNVFLKSPSIS
jgi:hypothetical protein